MPTLNWIGKEAVINHHNDVPFRVLERKYTWNSDGSSAQQHANRVRSDNKIIHGDNLEALKALLPEYEGRIKCIYIDPPYNTGAKQGEGGWCYSDNVDSPRIRRWLGQVVGKEAEDLTRHDKWLCMMYPRLKLLHKLLADDGAIFISIDDNEQANLKLICDEIFGAGNFILKLPRITKKGGKSSDIFAKNHDYIFVYSKTKQCSLKPFEHTDPGFKYKDEFYEQRGYYKLNQTLDYDSLQYSKSLDYPLQIDGNIYYPGSSYEKYLLRQEGNHRRADWTWRWSEKKFKFGYDNGFIVLKKSKNGTRIYTKTYQNATIEETDGEYWIEFQNRTKAISSLTLCENEFSNDNATKIMTSVFSGKFFDYSKPISIVDFILKLATEKSSIILDSFAGSGTTAHAVLNLNKQDGGNRKFILVEMEDYAENITAERVRRVINGYGEGKNTVEGTGGSFTFYELGAPIFNADGYLNESVGTEKLREYVWYTETRVPYSTDAVNSTKVSQYLLGHHNDTAYYFYYEPEQITTLDKAFLNTITQRAEQYVIYADNCLLAEEFMQHNHIIFKKIPRDIKKL